MNELTNTRGNRPGPVSPTRRFHREFWLVCLIVSLGYVEAIPMGFYRFRLIDLVLILSALYFVGYLTKGRIDIRIRWLVFLYTGSIVLRAFLELEEASGIEILRTLFGMAALYLAPVIFFVVRESSVDGKNLVRILAIACLVSLISQLGLLPWGESYVTGQVNLAPFLGIERRDSLLRLDYMETTITIWRALSVGLTLAVLLFKTGPLVKVLGVAGLILQYGGGSGGRSAILFLFLLPIAIIFIKGFKGKKARRLLWAAGTGALLAGFYLWSPIGADIPVKTGGSHYGRVTEPLIVVTEGWDAAESAGGLGSRTTIYEKYVVSTLSDPSVLLVGRGFREGGAFEWKVMSGQAHNVFLDILGLAGIVGLIFFLIFFGYVVSDLIKLVREAPEGTPSQIVAFSFAIGILFMVQYMLVQATMGDRSFTIVFYLLAGHLKPITRWLQEMKGPVGQV